MVNSGMNVSPIVGIARVVDGDSIEITGQAIRLEGIDAPELRQTCERNGATWPCGVEADAMLRNPLAIRVRSYIADALAAGMEVRVIALKADANPVLWRGLPLDFIAGLEEGLIRQMQPRWNRRGLAALRKLQDQISN